MIKLELQIVESFCISIYQLPNRRNLYYSMNSFIKTTQTTSFPFLFIHLHFLFFLLICITSRPLASLGCHEEERRALLNIKSSLEDPSQRLSSWQESFQHRNCCDWRGIVCSSESFHVISIDLRNIEYENYLYVDGNLHSSHTHQREPDTALRVRGNISHFLSNITHLEYLDLAFNDLRELDIRQFSYLTGLAHLDLSISRISASIPSEFSNMLSLKYLDLSCALFRSSDSYTGISCSKMSSMKWVRGLVNLQVLRLTGVDLSEATSSEENFSQHISNLWNLRELDISSCNISCPVFPIHQFHNLSNLSTLKMKKNNFNSSIPLQLANFTSLTILDLSDCALQGSIPYLPQLKEIVVSSNVNLDLTRMYENPWPRLQKLEISGINVSGSFLSSLSNAPLLVSLSASGCSIQGSLPSSISKLKYLNFLGLSSNNIQGPIPKSFCEIFSLQHLDLKINNITGTIPSCITKLPNLRFCDVSFNSIRGKVMINELNLTYLDLSFSKLTAIFIDQHLYPSHFRLESLKLRSCNLKGSIPTFICNFTRLEYLDLSYNKLTRAIPSCISKLKNLDHLDLSNNKLRGPLPLLPQALYTFESSHNKLNGEISIEAGERLSNISYIFLNNNEISGSIPSSICSHEAGKPQSIDFSYNKLSGIIPSSIGYCSSLNILKFNNNNLTGNVPNELTETPLQYLQLNNNNLDGKFPVSIHRLLKLEILDLGNNNFEGIIPMGLGSLSSLAFISLRSNKFTGPIPEDITKLGELLILDLSMNNLSGPIPIKIGSLTRITRRYLEKYYWEHWDVQYQLVIKGTSSEFEGLDEFRSGIDLSCNILSGNIPDGIGLLKGLVMLNLSHNHFSDNIPATVGNMSSLESLDLSCNRLSGHIPKSLTLIDTLGYLSLSHNNLSGRIPRTTHFDTLSLDGSAFAENTLLCGFPTKKDCEGDQKISTSSINPSNKASEEDREDARDKLLLYAITVLGFGVGFWGLFSVLLLMKRKWWFPYWKIVDSVAVKIVERCTQKN